MVGFLNFLNRAWTAVWPNLLASVLWIPATLIHVTRSNRKSLRVYFGDKPGPDEEGVCDSENEQQTP